MATQKRNQELVSILSVDFLRNLLGAVVDGNLKEVYALLAGRSGGQTLNGGTAASENLTLHSTANATRGKILFGTSGYDEANNRLGIATASPSYPLDVVGSARFGSANTPVDAGVLINTAVEVAANSSQNFRMEIDVDSSAVYLQANEYYSGGWQIYDTGKAPAQIRMTCNSADSSIGFYTKAASTAQSTLRATINKDGYFGVGNTPTAYIDAAASTTAAASIRIRSGTAPSSPNDGDIWYDGTNVKIRVGGTTKTFTIT